MHKNLWLFPFSAVKYHSVLWEILKAFKAGNHASGVTCVMNAQVAINLCAGIPLEFMAKMKMNKKGFLNCVTG